MLKNNKNRDTIALLDGLDAILDISDILPQSNINVNNNGDSVKVGNDDDDKLDNLLIQMQETADVKGDGSSHDNIDGLDTSQLDDLLVQMEETITNIDTAPNNHEAANPETKSVSPLPSTMPITFEKAPHDIDENSLDVLDTSQLDDILDKIQHQSSPQLPLNLMKTETFSTPSSSTTPTLKPNFINNNNDEYDENIEILSENEEDNNSTPILNTTTTTATALSASLTPSSTTATALSLSSFTPEISGSPHIPEKIRIVPHFAKSENDSTSSRPSSSSSSAVLPQKISSSTSSPNINGKLDDIRPLNSPFKPHAHISIDLGFGDSPDMVEILGYTSPKEGTLDVTDDDAYNLPSSVPQATISRKPLPSKRFVVYKTQPHSKASAAVSPQDTSLSPQQSNLQQPQCGGSFGTKDQSQKGYDPEQCLELIQQQQQQQQQQLQNYNDLNQYQTQGEQQQQQQQQHQEQQQQGQPLEHFDEHITMGIKDSRNPDFQVLTYEKLAMYSNLTEMEMKAKTEIDLIWEGIRIELAHGIWALMNLDKNNLRMFEDLIASFMRKNDGVTCPKRVSSVLSVLESCDVEAEQTLKSMLFPLLEAFFGSVGFTSVQIIHGINLAKNALNEQTLNPWLVKTFVPVLRGTCRYFLRGFTEVSAVTLCQRRWRSILSARRLADITKWFNLNRVRSFRLLMESERALAADINDLVVNVYQPLVKLSDAGEGEVLPQEDMNAILGKFAILYDTHTHLMAGLDEIVKTWPHLFYGPDLIVAQAYHFTAFNEYILEIDENENHVNQLRKKHKAFSLFLDKCITKHGKRGDLIELLRAPSKYIDTYDKYLTWLRTSDSQSEQLEKAIKILDTSQKYIQMKIGETRDKSITAEKLEALGPNAANFIDLSIDRKYVTGVSEVTITKGHNEDPEERCLYLFTDVLILLTRKRRGKKIIQVIKECFTLSDTIVLRSSSSTSTTSSASSSQSNDSDKDKTIKIWHDKTVFSIILNSVEERELLWFDLSIRAKYIAQEPADPSSVPAPSATKVDLARLVGAEGRAELGVPLIMENVCRYLSQHLEQPDMLRVASSREIANGVYRVIESDPQHRIPLRCEPYMVVHALKTFLQNLAVPLMTVELRDDFVELANFESEMVQADPEARKDTLAREAALIYERMPFANLQTYLLMVDILGKIAEKSALNSVPVKNLAGIFTPNIFGCKGDDNKEIETMQKLTHLVQTLIELRSEVKKRMTIKQTITL